MTKKESCHSCMRHTYWSASSLPNIIKLSKKIWELWPAQDFGFRGDNYITKKVRVVSLAWLAYWSSSTFLPNIIKICLRVSKLWSIQGCISDFCFRGDNYVTVRIVSLYEVHYWSSSLSLPNIIKLSQTVWELWPAQDFGFRGR